MSGTAIDRREARQALEVDALAELRQVGPERFKRTPLVERHAAATGLPASTLYRWLQDFIDSGRAGRRLAAEINEVAEARAATTPEPARAAAQEVVAALPAPPSPETIIRAASGSAIPFLARLQELDALAVEVEKCARSPDGKVRATKLLLQTIVVRLRALETGLKAQQAVAEMAEVERFHAAVLDEVAKESPVVAERIVRRLQQLNSEWAPPTG